MLAGLTRAASLRTRLLLAVVLLAGGVVLALDAVTYLTLGHYLGSRLDKQVAQTVPPVEMALSHPTYGGRGPGGVIQGLPIGVVGQVRDAAGRVEATLTSQVGNTIVGLPETRLPATMHDGFSHVKSSDGSDYRLLTTTTDPQGDRVLVGLPEGDIQATLHRLIVIELALTAGALVLLLGLGLLLVRLGLRPLVRMGDTAGKIAAGDLSQRVQPATKRTEVGRLGLSLNAMLSQIESEVARRTASEAQLRRFVADAGHELRTPLTSIRGYAELFRRGAANRPEDLALVMRRIEAEAGRMGGLVEDLLTLARLDEGRPIECAPVDLAAIARDAASDGRVVAPDRAVSASAAGLLLVEGDDARLRQVAANLVRNVLSHTPAGTPFEVVAHAAGRDVVLEVIDHGPGLRAEDAPHVFERFWRADASRQREQAAVGAGLGLSIVASLVAAHGGRVEAGATPGGGATFRVTLPRLTVPVESALV